MISTTPMEPCFLTAAQAVQAMRSGDLLVEDMAKSLLKRIEERDAEVKAWAYLDSQLILQRARELDAVPKEQRGLLHGLPVGVKDVIHTIGERV
jgi:Asp-tRNA(Asn)/Glu-tRNA(Gln) amidotransferase A subunit family amidase